MGEGARYSGHSGLEGHHSKLKGEGRRLHSDKNNQVKPVEPTYGLLARGRLWVSTKHGF